MVVILSLEILEGEKATRIKKPETQFVIHVIIFPHLLSLGKKSNPKEQK